MDLHYIKMFSVIAHKLENFYMPLVPLQSVFKTKASVILLKYTQVMSTFCSKISPLAFSSENKHSGLSPSHPLALSTSYLFDFCVWTLPEPTAQ